MGKTLWPAGSDSPAAAGRSKPTMLWVRACALLLGSSLLCLHILWLLNGRTAVSAREFPGALITALPDSLIRLCGAPLLATVNLALILALAGALVCLLGRWVAGVAMAFTVVIGLSAANQLKQQMLQEPILWQDMAILEDTFGLLKGFLAWTHVLLAVLGLAAVVLAYWVDRPLRFPRIRLRLRALGLVFCCLVPTVIMTLPPMVADRYIGMPALNDPRQDYQQILLSYSRSHGLLLSLLFSRMNNQVSQPADYEQRTVSDLASRLVSDTPRETPAVQPHVIAIMYESLWDPTRLPGVTITPDPIPTFRSPPGNGQAFQVLSPVFGRPTANVEFEFLTGMSTAFLPNGVIPYMGMIHEDIPSLPKLFRENGYRALAIHPYNCEFWRRDKVYPALGFERFEDIVGFYPSDVKGHYVSDDAVANHIIRCIDEATTPTFLFAVTMQNHAPHERKQYTSYDLTITHNIPDLNDDALTAYTQGVHDADNSLRKLIEHFSKSDRPVVIMAFGDHLVPLSGVYIASGYRRVGREDSPSERLRMRTTAAVLWTNMPEQLPPMAPVLSPNFIAPSLLSYVGISDPYFTGLLSEGRSISPGLSRYVSVDATGKPTLGEPEGSRQFLRDYRLLEHDLLLGKRYALPWLHQPVDQTASASPRSK